MTRPAPTEISDPYGLNSYAYENSLDSMAEAIPSLLAYLRKTAGTGA